MPEGDTLYKIAAYMQPRAKGARLVEAKIAKVRMQDLEGREITDLVARGKHLLISLSPQDDLGWILRVHLGMHGSWHVYRTGEAWSRPAYQASIALTLSTQQVFVCFNAEDAECLRPHEAGRSRSIVAHLGPDLLAPTCDFDEIVRRVRGRPGPLVMVDVLLKQSLAAGLGNVYKNDLLFLFGLHPLTPAGAVETPYLIEIFQLGRTLLQQNLGGWPRTTTYDRSRLGLVRTRPRLHIYGRRDLGCLSCKGPIEKAILGLTRRLTYWCPSCQAAKSSGAARRPSLPWSASQAPSAS